MSKARGLITGGDFESRSSGMYDSVDNIRIAAISQAGLKKVGSQQTNLYTTGLNIPYSFAWSPDGLHLYLAYDGDYIKHIECTSPFNTSGSSTQATFDCQSYDTSTWCIEVSPNGRYLYFGGTTYDTIQQFTMGTPWTLTTNANDNLANRLVPGYEQIDKRLDNIFSIGTANASVRGFEFNGDGTKFYLIGFDDDNIQQFTLSTAYDVGTASYAGAYDVGGDGLTTPYSFRWNNDGTKFFVVNFGTDAVVEYSVSNAYDVTSGTITEGTNFITTSYESNPYDVGFNADGTQMFVIGNGSDKIHEWTLSTGFDLSSTVTYVSGTALGLTNPSAFDISPDGTLMAVVDYNLDTLKGFTLSTPFDSSTISPTQSIDLSSDRWWSTPSASGSSYLTNYWVVPNGCRFNGDGTTITIMDSYSTTYDKAISVPLVVPYDVRGFADGTVDAYSQGVGSSNTIRFSRDGKKFYIMDHNDDLIYQWSLHTPYVLGRGSTTAVYDGTSINLSSNADSAQYSFDWTPDGKGIFVCGNSTDTISFWEVAVPYDVTSTITYGHYIDITGWEGDPREIRVVNCYNANKDTSYAPGNPRTAGYKLHVLGLGAKVIMEFDINF